MATSRIEDAGIKLEGARKDQPQPHPGMDRQMASGPETQPRNQITLARLWPLPTKAEGHRNVWQTLAAQIGPQRAARIMVLYGNLAPEPHPDGHFMIDGDLWWRAFIHGVGVLRELMLEADLLDRKELAHRYKARMLDFIRESFPDRITGDKVELLANCALGFRNRRRHNHTFTLTAIDGMRFDTLAHWGWGTDPRVGDKFAMGALHLTNRATAESFWRSVRAVAGGWRYLDQLEFETEEQALANTAPYVEKELQAPPKRKNKRQPVLWKREPLMASLARLAEQEQGQQEEGEAGNDPSEDDGSGTALDGTDEQNERIDRESALLVMRTGFDTQQTRGKTALDLIDVFGFRGVEFGNYVSQTQRHWFVDGLYDACMDLAHLMGVPPRFISLDGKLGIAYGSRGAGIRSANVAHFERDNLVIHLTRDEGPGSLAHELGHAFDYWIPTALAETQPQHLQVMLREHVGRNFGSELLIHHQLRPHLKEVMPALNDWYEMQCKEQDWLLESRDMDRSQRRTYWGNMREIFARGFEVMVNDAMLFKGRRNLMLVSGISEKSGAELHAQGRNFPYPLAGERQKVCQLMAAVVRAIRALQREVDDLSGLRQQASKDRQQHKAVA